MNIMASVMSLASTVASTAADSATAGSAMAGVERRPELRHGADHG